MKIVNKICKTMNKVNEDIICYGQNFAFVLDGKSKLGQKKDSTTKWYVKVLLKEMKKNINNDSLLSGLNKAIKNASYIFKRNFPAKEIPLVSGCFIRKNGTKVEVLAIGNSKCLVKTKKVELVADNRMDKVEKEILKTIKSLKVDEEINMLEARKKLEKTINDSYKKARVTNGYPIISDKRLKADDVVYKEFDYKDVVSAVVCTDGFYAYKDYLTIKDKDLYNVITNQGLSHCYSHIKRIQSKDTSLTGFPRITTYDDVSAIHIIFY